MTTANVPTKNLLTPVGRGSYLHLFEPKADDKGEMHYSGTVIFDTEAQKTPEFAALKAAAGAVAAEKFGKRLEIPEFTKDMKNPFLKSDTHKTAAEYVDGKRVQKAEHPPGSVFIRVRCKAANGKPGVVNQQVQPILDRSEIYSGCYVRANVNAFAYDNKGNYGVSFGLNHVQKVRDGDSLGGRTRPEDAFTAVAGADDGETGEAVGAAGANKPANALFE